MLQRLSRDLIGVLCLFVSAVYCSSRQTTRPTLLVDADHRTSISLDGDWHAIVDPYDNGYFDFRMQPRPDGYFLNEKPDTSRQLVEYDFCQVGDAESPGRLELAARHAVLLRRHGLVREGLSVPAQAQHAHVLSCRCGELCGHACS